MGAGGASSDGAAEGSAPGSRRVLQRHRRIRATQPGLYGPTRPLGPWHPLLLQLPGPHFYIPPPTPPTPPHTQRDRIDVNQLCFDAYVADDGCRQQTLSASSSLKCGFPLRQCANVAGVSVEASFKAGLHTHA